MGSKNRSPVVWGSVCMIILVNFTCHNVLHVDAGIVSECGVIDEIVARQDPRALAPWTAALYFQSTLCDFRPAGNGHGVIIGPTTVLIKGNFIWSNDGFGGIRMESYSPNHFIIIAGLKSKLPFVADQYTQFLKVASIQPHPASYDAFSEYDYAIVHLKTPIQFTSFVRPICIDALPDGTFAQRNDSLVNDHLTITGFRTGSGNFKSALHADKETFGLLSQDFCISKLQWDLARSSSAPYLIKSNTPCGISTKAMEDLIDIRAGIGASGTSNTLGYLKKILNFTMLEATKGYRPISNICFHAGAAIVTQYQGKWYLVGIVTESLGMSCDKNLYFVSFVASKNNLNWISQHLRSGSSSFVCSNGQSVHLESSLCNGEQNCIDGSDEDEKICTCFPMCKSSRCFLQPMCKHCTPSNTLRILSQSYNFSTAEMSQKKYCPPVIPPKRTTVSCKAPGLKSPIPCDHQHFPGTQAIFTCKYVDANTPGSYCVITCMDNGIWTDELNSLSCKPTKIDEDDNIFVAERRNLSAASVITDTITATDFTLTSSPTTTTTIEPSISFSNKNMKDKNGTLLCPPLKETTGTKITCWTATSSKRISCDEAMYPGSKAEFSCSRYYKPILSTATVLKHCQPDGEWSLNNRNFECRLDCGIPKNELIGHIVNGRETDGAKWPWHGLMFINLDKDHHNFTYICGSTLVSKRLLITAGHCVTNRQGTAKNPSLYKVVLAAVSNIYHKNILDDEIQIFDVTKIVVHPLFNPGNFEADIAIVQLSRPVEVTDYVRPSCIPSTLGAHTELKHLNPGNTGTVVGFGYDETGSPSKTLKEATLPVVTYKDCVDVSKIQHSSTQYCAGYTNGTSVCNGDSGSGHFFEEDVPQRRIYLQGIVSHGNRDESSRLCDHNQYSVFTKVGAFKNWISERAYELDDEF